jgi:hypothetical protein
LLTPFLLFRHSLLLCLSNDNLKEDTLSIHGSI